jgi:hypothetical protein
MTFNSFSAPGSTNFSAWRPKFGRVRLNSPSALYSLTLLLAFSAAIVVCRAESYSTAIQETTTQTWNDAIWEPGPISPLPGNDYEVLSGGLIHAATAGRFVVFRGASLTLDQGASLFVAGSSDEVLVFLGTAGNPGLVLNGGTLRTALDSGSWTFTISGQMAVVAPSAIYHSWHAGGFVIEAQITGTGDLSVVNGDLSDPLTIQSTNNLYSGTWNVQSGYLYGSGAGSLGTGDITISPGAALEVSYDIQTPGALTLLGDTSVMVLHQNCQFSAVSINGVILAPGTYPYNNLLAQFPGNFATGGSGSITVPQPPAVFVSPPPPPLLPGYYVDYAGGSDSNVGTNPASAWQHCPGDPAATGKAGSTPLHPGDSVFFKGGVTYTLTTAGRPLYGQTYGLGIGLNWSGAAGNPITYCATAAWGKGRAVFSDGYSANSIVAFGSSDTVSNLVFNNLEIGPIGGSATLPPDPGSAVPAKPGAGILAGGSLNNVTIANCYFHHLGSRSTNSPWAGIRFRASACSAPISSG